MKPPPENLLVIGGGRWARVLTQVASQLLGARSSIRLHTSHNVADVLHWASIHFPDAGLAVESDWPPRLPGGPVPVIVVNAAADHERAARWALDADLPVLVEKPMTLSASASESLVQLASRRNGRLAAGHVLLFAPHLQQFASRVAASGAVRELRIDWADGAGERREGELKHYDAGVPLYADVLPHIVSIISRLEAAEPRLQQLGIQRGGARVDLELEVGPVRCWVSLARDAARRSRVVEAVTSGCRVTLDFTEEPGTVTMDARTVSVEKLAYSQPRPVAGMLAAFLQWAGGGEPDPRLDTALALRAGRLGEEVGRAYRDALARWMSAALRSMNAEDVAALGYAFTEVLQRVRRMAPDELEAWRRALLASGSRGMDEQRCRSFLDAGDPCTYLRTSGIADFVPAESRS